MPKNYPWQRWPEKKNAKGKSSFHGQTQESAWKRSSVQQVKENIKDEAKSSRTYKRLAKDASAPEDACMQE